MVEALLLQGLFCGRNENRTARYRRRLALQVERVVPEPVDVLASVGRKRTNRFAAERVPLGFEFAENLRHGIGRVENDKA